MTDDCKDAVASFETIEGQVSVRLPSYPEVGTKITIKNSGNQPLSVYGPKTKSFKYVKIGSVDSGKMTAYITNNEVKDD